jgi:hypothetical protein
MTTTIGNFNKDLGYGFKFSHLDKYVGYGHKDVGFDFKFSHFIHVGHLCMLNQRRRQNAIISQRSPPFVVLGLPLLPSTSGASHQLQSQMMAGHHLLSDM